jgi:outer membrane protein assembly factor BamA
MTIRSGAIHAALLLLCTLPLLAQKKSPTQAIRFQGASQYTQQELLAAAGLKPDARLNPRDVKAHAKLLNDTGFFDVVKFTANSKALVFTLTPASQTFPLHLDNVPLAPGKDLDARLHDRFPLYHGLLPASGSVVDGIRQALEEMLAAKGIKASIKAAPTSGVGAQKITVMNFTVVLPAVHIGCIQLVGVSSAMQAKISLLVSGQTGNGFDTDNTAIGLQHAFEDLYQDQGYAAVKVSVAQLDTPIVSDQSVDIPYAVTIQEGGIYKLGTIELPAGAPVTRAEVDKMLAKYPAGSGRPLDLFLQAARDASHAKGYLDCSIVSHANFNEVTHIVNYTLEVAPGAQYHFASVKFDGAPDPMAARLKLAWKAAPGDVFDESYLANFTTLAQKKDKPLTKWLLTVLTTYDIKADPATHDVNCIFHFAKPAQNPR